MTSTAAYFTYDESHFVLRKPRAVDSELFFNFPLSLIIQTYFRKSILRKKGSLTDVKAIRNGKRDRLLSTALNIDCGPKLRAPVLQDTLSREQNMRESRTNISRRRAVTWTVGNSI